MTSDEEFSTEEFSPEQWERIRAQIRARGMTFEVFLPETQADWLREKIESGLFKDAGEAAFVAFQDMLELERHPEVRQALRKAMAEQGMESGVVSFEEMTGRHRVRLREYANSEPVGNKKA
jgi:Arc/MetJ-type ribon-helix-helix transcriptional regulator